MARSYPVWVDISSCIYNSTKSYGIRKHGEQHIFVGTSASNSHAFADIEIKVKEIGSKRHFKLYVDGVKIKEATVEDHEFEIIFDRLTVKEATPKSYQDNPEVQRKIEEAIHEQNEFWWGVVICEQYGEIVRIRVNQSEEAEGDGLTPIVKVKYGSPYAGGEPKGHIVKWYEL